MKCENEKKTKNAANKKKGAVASGGERGWAATGDCGRCGRCLSLFLSRERVIGAALSLLPEAKGWNRALAWRVG